MIGYKVFDKNWKCRDYQYFCPGEFVMNEKTETAQAKKVLELIEGNADR